MNNILRASKSMGAVNNITIRVLDAKTHEVVQEHTSHNTVTNSMLLGIAHYLTGDGILEQGYSMLGDFIPKYISLGTMGLINQDQDTEGLPAGIGEEIPDIHNDDTYRDLIEALREAEQALENAKQALEHDCTYYAENGECYAGEVCTQCADRLARKRRDLENAKEAYEEAYKAVISYSEERRFRDYMYMRPGYGADGYDQYLNNSRKYFGLGPVFADRENSSTIKCELISPSFPRAEISFRDVVPEIEAELPRTIDVVFSALISTGALRQFREKGKNYLYITECGLWSQKDWEDSGENGLLAAYRIASPNEWEWQVVKDNLTDDGIREYIIHNTLNHDPSAEDIAEYRNDDSKLNEIVLHNRRVLKESIIKVGLNQVVQVIWKVQLGSIDEFASMYDLRKIYYMIDEEQGNASYVEAVGKLRQIRNKYKSVSGLDEVFDLIDDLK